MKAFNQFFVLAILLSYGCAPPASEPEAEAPAVDIESERNALMVVDKAWSETVNDIDAFLSYIADGAHFMPFGAPLAEGDAIRTTWEGLTSLPGFGLSWQATDADVGACRRSCVIIAHVDSSVHRLGLLPDAVESDPSL